MELHDDDQPIGRVLSRREALTLLGGTGAAAVAAGTGFINLRLAQTTPTPTGTSMAVPSCVVRPALTEGPYFVDDMLNRSDIRIEPADESIKAGKYLRLIFNVTSVTDGTCSPLAGAQVDVWHCDALGAYSGVSDPGFDNSELTFLRGYQVTDEAGIAEFVTIYPGWYPGRTVHIHFKIRTDTASDTGYEFTSQPFFDEDLTDIVHAEEPYNDRGYRNTLNEDDGIFEGSDGLLTLIAEELEEEDEATGETVSGYKAIFSIGLDLSEEAQEAGVMGGRPGGNPPGGGRPGGTPRP